MINMELAHDEVFADAAHAAVHLKNDFPINVLYKRISRSRSPCLRILTRKSFALLTQSMCANRIAMLIFVSSLLFANLVFVSFITFLLTPTTLLLTRRVNIPTFIGRFIRGFISSMRSTTCIASASMVDIR
jgi:hypothetical protein